ncbi:MAG: hypothetical protein KDB61_01430, partial [Planctomycetes bacterium]|nr:hypothetical protein [Planctomycetota bacterium]
YIVQAFGTEIEGLPILYAFSQSSVVSTDSLRGRFIANIAHFLEDLDELTDEEFEANRLSAIAKLEEKSHSFAEALARNADLADNFGGDFQDREKQIAAVRALTREGWIAWARKYLTEDARTLCVQMDGRKERHRYQERSADEIRQAADGWHKRALTNE